MRQRRRRTGANAVEFALTLPVIIFILSGVIDYGYFLHLQYNMINAVSQGARAGATTQQDATPAPLAVAQSVAEDVWTASGLPGFPSVSPTFSGAAPDQRIVVGGTLPYRDSLDLVGLLPTPANVSHQTTMRMDDQP